jgi:Na+-translocating ferredoxin:NAD+ oxidoreductase subunit G
MIKKLFKIDFVRMFAALAAVGILSGTALVFVYNYSMPKIKANITAATEDGIKSIFPEAVSIEKADMDGLYKAKDASGGLIGYAFTAEGNGYQGTISMIAGISPDLSEMRGIEILDSQETPGLGAEITSDDFRDQFNGLSVKGPIGYVKNKKPDQPNQIEAITGATISSRAVVNILNKRIEEIRQGLGKK